MQRRSKQFRPFERTRLLYHSRLFGESLESRHMLSAIIPETLVQSSPGPDDTRLSAEAQDLPLVGSLYHATFPKFTMRGTTPSPATQSLRVNGYPVTELLDDGTWSLVIGDTLVSSIDTDLVPAGSRWHFNDTGDDLGDRWRVPDYSDITWPDGIAPLGYGQANIATETGYVDTNPFIAGIQKNATTYFRHTFHLDSVAGIGGLVIRIAYDDAAIVYVNGTPVVRTAGLPPNPRYNTYSSVAVTGTDQTKFTEFVLPPTAINFLQPGGNTLAVEVHQQSATSPDLHFDLQLVAQHPQSTRAAAPILYPGINRFQVEAFDGPFATGNVLDTAAIDVWYTGEVTPLQIDYQPVVVESLHMFTPATYLPDIPFLVRLDARTFQGNIARDLWNATASISSSNPNVTLSTSSISLSHGVGSALLWARGNEPFQLTATVGSQIASRWVTPWPAHAHSFVGGRLPSGTTEWSGLVHVTSHVTVPTAATLVILPGTLVLVDGLPSNSQHAMGITIEGQLSVRGTADNPVTWTSSQHNTLWGQFDFDGGRGEFSHTMIHRAGNSPRTGQADSGTALRMRHGGHVTFYDGVISDLIGRPIYATDATLDLRRSLLTRVPAGIAVDATSMQFEHNWITDVAPQFQSATVAHDNDGLTIIRSPEALPLVIAESLFAHISGDAIVTHHANISVRDIIVSDITDAAIALLGGQSSISGILIERANMGFAVAVDADSRTNLRLDQATIVEVNQGITALDFGTPSPSSQLSIEVTNSIIWPRATGDAIHSDIGSSDIRVSYSTLPDPWAGPGNLNLYPLFAHTSQGNYRLLPGSPGINAGHPAQFDPDGTRADQGFYRNGTAGQFASATIANATLRLDTIMAPWNGPYRIAGEVVVDAGARLTVLPGTTVYFEPGAKLVVRGSLAAEGNQQARIRWTVDPQAPFTPDLPGLPDGPARWAGIHFHQTRTDNNRLVGVDIEYAQNDQGSIGIVDSHVTIDQITIRGSHRRLIRGVQASLILTNSVFPEMFAQGESPSQLGLDQVAEQVMMIGEPPVNGNLEIRGNVFGRSRGQNDVIHIANPNRNGTVTRIVNNLFFGSEDDILDLRGDAYVADNLFSTIFKSVDTSTDDLASAISTASDQQGTTLVAVRNRFYDIDTAIELGPGTELLFENNTVYRVHPEFSDRYGNHHETAAIVRRGEAADGPINRHMYVAGNIFSDLPRLLDLPNHSVSAGDRLHFHANLVDPRVAMESLGDAPETILDSGSSNRIGDPLFRNRHDASMFLSVESPAIGTGPLGHDMGGQLRAGIWITGEPPSLTSHDYAVLTVGGPGLVAYQYRLDQGEWSSVFPIGALTDLSDMASRAATLQLTDLAPGTHQIEVRGQDFAGAWQKDTSVSQRWTVSGLRVSEVMFHPSDATGSEFVEFVNMSNDAVDLSEFRVDGDITVTFPPVRVPAQERFVIAGNLPRFLAIYGNGPRVVAEFTGRLKDESGRFVLSSNDTSAAPLLEVAYQDQGNAGANGGGFALEFMDLARPSAAWSDPTLWQVGSHVGGTPGWHSTELLTSYPIVFSEIVRDSPDVGMFTVEIHNAGAVPVDIGNWSLSTSLERHHEFRLMPTAIVPPNEYLVLTASDILPGVEHPASPISLRSDISTDLYLWSQTPTNGRIQLVDLLPLRADRAGESWGRTGTGIDVSVGPLLWPTLGDANAHARIGPAVISEVHDMPTAPSSAALAIDPTLGAGDLQFIEVHNVSNESITFDGWQLDGSIMFDFPLSTQLHIGQSLVIVPFDPTGLAGNRRLAAFRTHFALGTNIAVVGPYFGTLDEPGTHVVLEQPRDPLSTEPESPWDQLLVDQVAIHRYAPWPSRNGDAQSLQRTRVSTNGMFAGAWRAAAASPGSVGWSGAMPGDLSGDQQVNAIDLDLLLHAANLPASHLSLDQNGDAMVNGSDVRFVVEQILQTSFGDANLDRRVDADDANRLRSRLWHTGSVGWSMGDFNGDRTVDGSDYNLWNENKFRARSSAETSMGGFVRNPFASRSERLRSEVLPCGTTAWSRPQVLAERRRAADDTCQSVRDIIFKTYKSSTG